MKTNEDVIRRLGEQFADILVECTDYVHDNVLTAEDVAKVIFDELEDWMIYYGSMTTAAEAIKYALGQRVS
jgi:Zn/Cd-binding protein ZinT